MKRFDFVPLRFETLGRSGMVTNGHQVEPDARTLIQDLVTELNERFNQVDRNQAGRGHSISQTALVFETGSLARVPQLGDGVLFRFSAPKAATIPGFAGGYAGRIVVIQNTSTASYTIAHESQTALPEERVTARTAASLTVAAGGGLVLVYDSTTQRWIPVIGQL